MVAAVLFLITFLLTLGGVALYGNDLVGWAQFFWVLASGSAGAWVAVIVERRVHRDLQHDLEWMKNQPP